MPCDVKTDTAVGPKYGPRKGIASQPYVPTDTEPMYSGAGLACPSSGISCVLPVCGYSSITAKHSVANSFFMGFLFFGFRHGISYDPESII